MSRERLFKQCEVSGDAGWTSVVWVPSQLAKVGERCGDDATVKIVYHTALKACAKCGRLGERDVVKCLCDEKKPAWL